MPLCTLRICSNRLDKRVIYDNINEKNKTVKHTSVLRDRDMNIVFLCNALLKVEKSIIVKLGHNTQVTVNITNMHAHSPETRLCVCHATG